MTRPTIGRRIDAVVAAMKIYEMVKGEERYPYLPGSDEPFMIVGALREQNFSAVLIRRWLDSILEIEMAKRWRKCWVFFYVAEIERALGMAHDPRSAEALIAYEGRQSWSIYSFPPEPAATEPAVEPGHPRPSDEGKADGIAAAAAPARLDCAHA